VNEPKADVALALGDLYAHLGQSSEANTNYRLFEDLERKNAEAEKSLRHLISYWLDHDKNLAEAVLQARREREKRKDIVTCDLLAWALFKNGDLAGAKSAIDEALRLGTKDARINYHAGMIYNAAGSDRAAIEFLRKAVANPAFDLRDTVSARQLLARVGR
jgi:Flp pilus assembly protein TadD